MKHVNQFKISETGSAAVSKYAKQAKNSKDSIGRAIDAFLSGTTGKFDKYLAVENALVYRTVSEKRDGTMEVLQNVIAVRLKNGTVLGNSSILPLIGRTVNWGREHINRHVAEVQTRLSTIILMVPFTVFQEAGLNLNKFEVLERGPEETVTRAIPNPKYDHNPKSKHPKTIDETVHFTGATLFKVDGKVFLFDVDRRELKHKIFNAFLVEVADDTVTTIQEAYESLKPKEVKDAEARGLEVLRQGEWFFIPVHGEFEPVKATRGRWDKKEFEPLTLRAGDNRPNTVSKYAQVAKGEHVVTGYVEHTGREHAKLVLKGWFQPVPNTSTRSFTITGDVD